MKVLTVLSTMGLATVIGGQVTHTAVRTARLTNPAMITEPVLSKWTPVPDRVGWLEKTAPPSLARSLGLSDIEQYRIREAIRGQIRALAARDAERAFAYLAPVTKDYFSEGTAFLRKLMVQIRPLVDASGYSFTDVGRVATDAIQNVFLTDNEGREWLARFTLERQPDGSWGIKSCEVKPNIGSSI
jgi:hypothetical protein